jgi:hypothetical protein
MQHVWNVMYFYQRLWLAIHYKHVRKDQVPGMFGENFYWWWINSYATQLAPKDGKGGPDATSPPKVDWQAARQISDLKRWIDHKTKRDKKLGERELVLWTERAKRLGGPVPEETVKGGNVASPTRTAERSCGPKPRRSLRLLRRCILRQRSCEQGRPGGRAVHVDRPHFRTVRLHDRNLAAER